MKYTEKRERVRRAQNIVGTIQGFEDDFPINGAGFYDSVKNKAESIMENVENFGDATDRQLDTLENMLAGCEKWL